MASNDSKLGNEGPEPDFRARLVTHLRATIERKGLTLGTVEGRLGRGRGYLTDAIAGHKRLSLELLMAALECLAIRPESFFQGMARGRGRVAERVQAEIAAPTPASRPLSGDVVVHDSQARSLPAEEPEQDYQTKLLKHLQATIELSGLTIGKVEGRLGRGRGYVSEAISRRKQLRVELLLAVLECLGVSPEEFLLELIRGDLALYRVSGDRFELGLKKHRRAGQEIALQPPPTS